MSKVYVAKEYRQLVTPSNPPSGFNKFYFKSDDELYKLNSAGVEVMIGGSGWSLDGNSNGVEKYLGTNDSYDLPIRTNAIEVARFTTTGRLGIGTPTPLYPLHIEKNTIQLAYFKNTSGSSNIIVDADATNSSSISFYETGTNYWQIGKSVGGGDGKFHIFDAFNGLNRIVVQQDGNVGIGTASPTSRLHIVGSGTTSATYSLKIMNSSLVEIFNVRDDRFVEAGNLVTGSLSIGFNSASDLTNFYNTFVGISSGTGLTTGTYNTGFGTNSLNAITTAARSTALGYGTLVSLSTGFGATAAGWGALSSVTNLSQGATAFGFSALQSQTADYPNTAVGFDAGQGVTTGTGLALFGFLAWQFGTTGLDNSVFGDNAFRRNVTGSRNSVFGSNAGQFAIAAASDNIYIGYYAGYFNNDVGTGAGTVGKDKNIFIGVQAGYSSTSADSVFIGYTAGFSETTDNKLRIETDLGLLIYGDFSTKKVGINTTTLDATLHLQGSGATQTTSSFYAQNSTNTAFFRFKDDGQVNIASTLDGASSGLANFSYESTTGGVNFQLIGSLSGTANEIKFYNTSTLDALISDFAGYLVVKATNRIDFRLLGDNVPRLFVDGNVGVGSSIFATTATLHVQGIGNTSATYSLKIENSSATALLQVRDDGKLFQGNSNLSMDYDSGNDFALFGTEGYRGIVFATNGNTYANRKVIIARDSGTSGYMEVRVPIRNYDTFFGNNGCVAYFGTISAARGIRSTNYNLFENGAGNALMMIASTTENAGLKASWEPVAHGDTTSSTDATYHHFGFGVDTITSHRVKIDFGLQLVGNPTTGSSLLDINSTTGALVVSRMSITDRNALTAVNGMIIYNSTTNAFNFYENGAWVTGSGLA